MSTLFSKKRGSQGRKRPRSSAVGDDDRSPAASTGPSASEVVNGGDPARTPSAG